MITQIQFSVLIKVEHGPADVKKAIDLVQSNMLKLLYRGYNNGSLTEHDGTVTLTDPPMVNLSMTWCTG